MNLPPYSELKAVSSEEDTPVDHIPILWDQRSEQPMPPPKHHMLGRYEALKEIGRGEMGTVYLGHDPFSDREVAIKVAHPEAMLDEDSGHRYRKLFFNEAKVTGMLHHPNIVEVYDAGFDDEAWYMVMEYVSGGQTLHRHTRPDRLLPLDNLVRVVFKCAKALDYAHRKGVIHRDIKPKNILLTEEGEVKVSDFSVALRTGLDVTDTQVDGYLGSPLYMSPEQVKGDTVTQRSDIFSLGVLMYELLTGKAPFGANTIATVIYQITNKQHASVREIRAEVPETLEAIVNRCLTKDPDRRYASALDLAADLSTIYDNLGGQDEELPRFEKFKLVKNLSFFDEFSDSEIWEIINAAVWQDYAKGEEIIHEGEVDNSFFVIVRGTVAVRKGDTTVDSLTSGDCFGETGFIPGKERSTSIVANHQTSTIKVRSSMIERTSKDCQLRFHRIFLNKIVERLSRADERIFRERQSNGEPRLRHA